MSTLTLLPIVVIAVVVGCTISWHDAVWMVINAVSALLVGFLVVVPLMFRYQKRRRARVLAESPPGTLFASYAGGFVPALVPDARVSGILRIGVRGVSFTTPDPRLVFPEADLPWSDIESLDVGFETPVRMVVQLRTVTRQQYTWRVTGVRELRAAMAQLQRS